MTFTDVLLSGIWFRNQTGSWKIQTKQNRVSVKICPSQIAQPQGCAWIRTVNLLNIQKSEFIYTLWTCPWEPLKLEAALWSSWGNNTTNTAFICLFPYSNQTLKLKSFIELGSVCVSERTAWMQRSGPGRKRSLQRHFWQARHRVGGDQTWQKSARGVSRRAGHFQFSGSPCWFTISPVIKGNQPRNYQSAN